MNSTWRKFGIIPGTILLICLTLASCSDQQWTPKAVANQLQSCYNAVTIAEELDKQWQQFAQYSGEGVIALSENNRSLVDQKTQQLNITNEILVELRKSFVEESIRCRETN
jgi:hypothetical protein